MEAGLRFHVKPRGADIRFPACPAPCRRCVRDAAVLAEQRRSPSGRVAPPAQRRALGGSRRSGGAGFRPPVPAAPSHRAGGEAPCDDIEALKEKDRALDREIAQLLSEGYSVEELEKHISLLHEYNEIKDAGQMLLGKLAVIRGVTTKQLYPEYDLELND
ncbi:DNA repair protein SWI5 homolog [Meleagris gallopavo]|uniref:DNA repair protein SWI5 homolog n=1 Tax=Meleagris gallopavo TaxID=9103 RepID=UPI0012AB742E|nr:DNA repair protein SWI5 homolog [Meleagris gallopavo]